MVEYRWLTTVFLMCARVLQKSLNYWITSQFAFFKLTAIFFPFERKDLKSNLLPRLDYTDYLSWSIYF